MDKKKRKDFIIKICCLIVAFGLWLYISNIENPIKTTVIRNVKVNIINKDILSQYNLVQLPKQSYTVNITVKGATSDIYALKASSFKLEADMSSYALKKGTMRIPVEVKSSPSNISIINTESLWVKMELDNFVEKKVPVKLNIKGEAKNGFKTASPLITPTNVTVSGAEQYVNYVSAVSTDVDLANEEKNIDGTYKVRPVDISGNIVDYVAVEPNGIKVQIALDKTKYVPIEANIKSSKDKFLTGVSIVPESVSISGDEYRVKKIEKILTEEIDLNNVNNGATVEIPLRIPEGIKASYKGNVKVKITYNTIIQKNISLKVDVKNLKDNLEAVLNKEEVLVTVSGNEGKIKSLKNTDMKCSIDLNSLGEGIHNIPVKIELPDGIKNISYNPKTISVTIKKKEVTETDGNSNQ
ncbi:CdaR family protein [Haloimpatiens massiliensis]|uniref:CdaR family protein n=1 Tax=Haloimpatiens massiliensis TaxID=1658110 RepID=UPI000C8319A9|nr:CdaR family protein [Haloimpatiens massiliensis]